jgi:flagellar M-ring protein FliF
MNDTLLKVARQTQAFYRGLTPGRRLSLVLIVLLTLAATAGLVLLATHEGRTHLATGLSPEEVQTLATRLKERNIPCYVSAAGDSVEVANRDLDAARLELAASGLHSGGVGFELFDREEIGLTSFREQINYRRALEGELARSIRSLSEVRAARVHLVLPNESIYRERTREASAAVVLNLHPGRRLDRNQIKGIRFLVASGVEGLSPERVTVLDGQGAVLARMGGTDSADLDDERLQFQHAMEGHTERRVLDLIEPLVGAGHVVAQVTAEVDFQHLVETSEEYNPERTVVRSEQRTNEERTGGEDSARGVAGAASNLPGGPGGTVTSDGTKFTRRSETVNYEVDKKVLRRESPEGALKRLSVAVVVDGQYKQLQDGDATRTEYQPRGKEEMDQLVALVKKAVGYDAQRGDQVEVSNVAFQPLEPAEETSSWPTWVREVQDTGLPRILGVLALAVIVLLLLIRPAFRALGRRADAVILPQGRPMTVTELENTIEARPAGLLLSGQAGAGDQTEAVQTLRRLARENPQRATQLLRSWLEDSK